MGLGFHCGFLSVWPTAKIGPGSKQRTAGQGRLGGAARRSRAWELCALTSVSSLPIITPLVKERQCSEAKAPVDARGARALRPEPPHFHRGSRASQPRCKSFGRGSRRAENWALGREASLPLSLGTCHGLHHACSAGGGKRLSTPFGLFVCIPGLPQTQ